MKTRRWAPVLLSFAVGSLGIALRCSVVSFSGSWGRLVAGLFYIPVVIAGVGIGSRAALIVAIAAGCVDGAAALRCGASWVDPVYQAALLVCVGLTAGSLAEWRATFTRPAARRALSAKSLAENLTEVSDPGDMTALGRMVAGLVHQFRTPLTSIEGAGWLLEDSRLPDEKRREFVDIIRKESRRLDRVLSDALEFTRPRKPRLQMVDFASLVDQVIQVAGPKDHGPFVLFRTDLPPDLPPLRCDPEQIRQALLNLAMNAIQATPGGGQIVISARAPNSYFRISVQDHGQGVPAPLRDKIFDPFFTTRDTALGLGLAVVRRIVTAHGGQVAVEPNVDHRGTCVTLLLPLE